MAGPALLTKYELKMNTMNIKLHNVLVIRNRDERHVLHLVGAGVHYSLHQMRPKEIVVVNNREELGLIKVDNDELQLPAFMVQLLS